MYLCRIIKNNLNKIKKNIIMENNNAKYDAIHHYTMCGIFDNDNRKKNKKYVFLKAAAYPCQCGQGGCCEVTDYFVLIAEKSVGGAMLPQKERR